MDATHPPLPLSTKIRRCCWVLLALLLVLTVVLRLGRKQWWPEAEVGAQDLSSVWVKLLPGTPNPSAELDPWGNGYRRVDRDDPRAEWVNGSPGYWRAYSPGPNGVDEFGNGDDIIIYEWMTSYEGGSKGYLGSPRISEGARAHANFTQWELPCFVVFALWAMIAWQLLALRGSRGLLSDVGCSMFVAVLPALVTGLLVSEKVDSLPWIGPQPVVPQTVVIYGSSAALWVCAVLAVGLWHRTSASPERAPPAPEPGEPG